MCHLNCPLYLRCQYCPPCQHYPRYPYIAHVRRFLPFLLCFVPLFLASCKPGCVNAMMIVLICGTPSEMSGHTAWKKHIDSPKKSPTSTSAVFVIPASRAFCSSSFIVVFIHCCSAQLALYTIAHGVSGVYAPSHNCSCNSFKCPHLKKQPWKRRAVPKAKAFLFPAPVFFLPFS